MRDLRDFRAQQKGFTLIELLIAVLIIGILASIALPAFNEQRARAKDSAAQQSLEAGLRAAKAVYAEGETFPSANLDAILDRAERSADFALGTGYPASPGQINVERVSGSRAVLRATSASSSQVLLDIDEAAASVTRRISPRGASMVSGSNYVANPSAETNLTSWRAHGTWATAGSAYDLVLSRVSSERMVGSYSVAATSGSSAGQYSLGYNLPALTPGNTYTAAVWVKAPSGTIVRLCFGDTVNGVGAGQTTVTANGQWQRITATKLWPASPGTALMEVVFNATDATIYVDGRMVVDGSVAPAYFDGDMGGGAWSAAAHASTSTGPINAKEWNQG